MSSTIPHKLPLPPREHLHNRYYSNKHTLGPFKDKDPFVPNGCPTVIGRRAGEGEEARVPENGGSDRPTALFLADCARQRARSTRFHTQRRSLHTLEVHFRTLALELEGGGT
jgi:hypothetical protein